MSVLMTIHSSSYDVTFECKREDSDLWKSAAIRILKNRVSMSDVLCAKVDIADYQDMCGKRGVRALKQLVAKPEPFIEVEKVMQLIVAGSWDKIDPYSFQREQFKWIVRQIWRYARAMLPFECQVIEVLLEDGNGGLDAECIFERLLRKGPLSSFGKVRDALGHLCKLRLVEHVHGQFSVTYGLIDWAAR
jgi:hypothetical protein